MPVTMTFTANGEQIGTDLADDMEDAADALGAFAVRLSPDDLEELGDHLDSLDWNETRPKKKAALIGLAEFIIKTLKKD